MPTEQKKFHLRVYDNFHYMNEEEAYDHGQYDTYEEALIAAKAIVDEFFGHNWNPGIKPDYLLGQYALYGDDPIIDPDEHGEHGEHGRFSARTYAISRAAEICRNLETQ